MNIQTGTPSYQSILRQTLSVTDRPSYERPAPAADTFKASNSTFDMGETLKWGALGALPGVGAASNLTLMVLTGVAGQKDESTSAFLGLASNVLGTGALITGLLIGSTPTSVIGAGLLLGSGVASGFAIQ